MKFQDLFVEHDYYCSDSNYYSREAQSTHESFQDFIAEMGDSDIDLNLCFRFDIKQDEENNLMYAEIFIMQQRKGRFWPHFIKNINESDFEAIKKYLTPHWEKIKQIWKPFSE